MRTLPVCSVLALALAPRVAGATVNIERYRLALEDDGTTGELSLGVISKTGNVEYFETALSSTAGMRRGDHLLLAVVSGKYAAKRSGDDFLDDPAGTLFQTDARYTNKLLGALRYNLTLSDRLAGELFGQVEYDEFLRMDLRALGGTGVRLTLLDADHADVHFGTGYMLELERQDPDLVAEDPATLAHRWTSYLSFTVEPTDGVTISSTTYAQPRVPMLSDYRLLEEASLDVALGEHFSLGIGLTLRHDSDPALLVASEAPLRPTDTELTNKLSLEF